MADSGPTTIQFPSIPAERSVKSRRPSGKGMDRLSGDSNSLGEQRITEVPSKGIDNRGDGGSRAKEESGASSQGDNRLPVSPASPSPLPTSEAGRSIFTSADNVLKTIADRFNAAREEGKVVAWRQLQKDLMDASPWIVPVFIPYKDLIQIVADIEKEIKGTTSSVGRSNEEILADFLSGGASLPDIIPPLPPVGLDTAVIVGED